MLTPIALPPNQPPERFYRGGPRIAAFRGVPERGARVPEDWIASTTCLAGETSLGLSTLPDGRTLASAIAADPAAWLGERHLARYGVDTKLLVKLLDAGQRLPIHAHPDGAFASAHLTRTHGKAEAWYILGGGSVFLGLKADLDRDTLAAMVHAQAVTEMLPLLHEVHVEIGDTVFVPAGWLHAIGEGVFLAELQEPEDLSILLEWRGFELDGESDGHLGLGFDVALDALDLRGRSADEVAGLVTSGLTGPSILAPDASPFFRLGRTVVTSATELEQGFCVLIVTRGSAELSLDGGYTDHVRHGSTVLIPFAAGTVRLKGDAEILELRPPDSGDWG